MALTNMGLKLISLYNNHIKMPPEDKKYKNIIYRITETIISGICRHSELFSELSFNCRPYHVGCHWDGLHCDQQQTADAYFVLDVSA